MLFAPAQHIGACHAMVLIQRESMHLHDGLAVLVGAQHSACTQNPFLVVKVLDQVGAIDRVDMAGIDLHPQPEIINCNGRVHHIAETVAVFNWCVVQHEPIYVDQSTEQSLDGQPAKFISVRPRTDQQERYSACWPIAITQHTGGSIVFRAPESQVQWNVVRITSIAQDHSERRSLQYGLIVEASWVVAGDVDNFSCWRHHKKKFHTIFPFRCTQIDIAGRHRRLVHVHDQEDVRYPVLGIPSLLIR